MTSTGAPSLPTFVSSDEIQPTHLDEKAADHGTSISNLPLADGSEEVTGAGDVYHWPAGHTAHTDEAVVFVEIGPVGPMREFNAHVRQLLG